MGEKTEPREGHARGRGDTGSRRMLGNAQRRTRSGVYAELSLMLAKETDLGKLVANTCVEARRVLDFDHFGLLWLSPMNFDVGTFFDASVENSEVTSREIDIRDSLFHTVMEERDTWIFYSHELDEVMTTLFSPRPTPDIIVATPVEVSGRVLGLLILGASRAIAYQARDIEAVHVLAVHLASALQVARSNEEIRHLASIVQTTDLVIIAYDLAGRITSWNPAAERILGYSANEMVGEPVTRIIPPSRHEEHRAALAAIQAGEPIAQRSAIHLGRFGRQVDVTLLCSPVRNSQGKVVGAVDVARDVTHERNAEERFRLAVESAPNAMIMVDTQGRISLVNSEAERLFGYGHGELIGMSSEKLLPTELRADLPRQKASFFESPKRRLMGEGGALPGLRKDGSRVLLEVGLTPLSSPEGPMQLIAIVDITERKRYERAQEELLRQLREAVDARDTFLSIASHELKTPLTALQLSVQATLRRLRRADGAPPSLERIQEKLDATQRQIHRLSVLIDQLLDVSRISTGRLSLEPQDFDLTEVLAEVVDRFSDDHDGVAPTIRIHLEGSLKGKWDRSRVDQILTNLISNALRYGEGKPVHLEVMGSADRVRIAVQDYGIGIAPEQQQRIFERFERLVSHRHFGGLGLGLWIVRQFVEAHGGTIQVQSKLGEGSTFVVTLPRITAPT